MKNSSKTNILLIILLVITLLMAGFLGFNYYRDIKAVKAEDFSNKKAKDVYEWCSALSSRYACEFVYEESREFDKDTVFYQSVNAGEKIADKIIFKISSGKIEPVEVINIDNNTTRVDVENWLSKNKIETYNFIEEENENVEKGIVIRIDPNSNIYPDTPLTIYVSSGSKEEESKQDSADSIVVEYGDYIGISVSDFESKTKARNLTPTHNESRDAYSSSVTKGNIVWHGSGTYVKDEKISYGISKGVNENQITVKAGTYIGLSETDFIDKGKQLGLKPNHNESRDDYSDTVEKGNIVWHGSGVYDPEETFNYGLSLGKKNSDSDSSDIEVTNRQYANITAEEFESKTKAISLTPYHDSSLDDYSDTVDKGKVIWHGYGIFEKNERIRYGLSLGKSGSSDSSSSTTYVSNGQFTKLTPDEFNTKTKALGLDPYHDPSVDAYSDTIEKGKVVWHGYGEYVKNERIRYGLSLGKKDSSSPSGDNSISVSSYAGKNESELTSFLSSKGLKGSKSEDYSSYAKGVIVSNDTGNFAPGATIKYVVSLGEKPVSTATLNSFSDLVNLISSSTYDAAVSEATKYLKNAGFTNYTFKGATSRDDGAGVLLSITVDGNSHFNRAEYKTNAAIVVTICTGNE